MKKNYCIFLLALFLSAVWNGASALIWDVGSRQTEFKAGDKFVIVGENSGWWTGTNYANGFGESSPTVLESCVIELEATGETGRVKGHPSYYFKQVSTGLYFGSGGMKTNKADAFKYEILVNSKDKDKLATIPDTYCEDSLTSSPGATEETIVFATYTVSGETKTNTMLGNYNSSITHWTYSDTNAWKVFSVTSREDYVEELNQLITMYEKESYISSPTNAPGFYPKEAVDRFDAAMIAANNAVVTEDDDVCMAAANDLRSAQANVDSLGFPMKEGYFRFRSAYPEYFKQQGVDKGIYINSNDNQLKWNDLDLKNAYFIFKVTKNADGKNWDAQNLGTDGYITTAVDATTETPSTAQVFTAIGGGQWNFNSPDASSYHTEGHSSGAGKSGDIVSYSGGRNTASSWFVDEVSDMTLIDSLTQAMGQVKLNIKMTKLVATAKATYQKGWTNLNMITDATQLSSNAVQLDEGKIEFLLDGDPATFFHSRWGGEAVSEYHYLQVQMNKPISEFQLYTKTRDNNNNRPDSIVISASNDKNTWTEIGSLPNANDTLPYTVGTPDFNSSMINLNGSYSNVRFTVITTAYGGKPKQGFKGAEGSGVVFNGYPFFTYSEFQMYPKDKIDPNSQNYFMPAATALKAAIDIADTIKVAATEAQMATLQAAIDAYNNAFVDTTRLTKAITDAQALVDNAIPGTSMGEVDPADVDVFASAVAAAKAVVLFDSNAPAGTGLITRTALDAAIAQLKAAEKTFASSVVSIVPNTWYYIQNRMDKAAAETRFDGGIYATEGALKWGGLVNGNFEQSSNAFYMWRFVAMSDSTYAVQNMATGQYMAATTGASVQVKQSSTPVPFFVKYFGAAQFGLIPNIEKDPLPLHAAAGEAVVGWENGANSASAWTFSEVAAVEINAKEIEMNSIFVSTLPFDYTVSDLYYMDADGIDGAVKAYSIVGKEGPAGAATAIKLHEYDASDVIPAGTPVIMVIGDYAAYDAETPMGTLIFAPSYNINNPDPNDNLNVMATPLSVNGLVGVFNNVALPRDGVGLLESGKLRVVKATETTGYGAGYIDESLITETPDLSVDLTLTIGEGPALDIDGVTGGNASKVGKIYTVDGVYAGSTVTGLKPGLYIINGKVVRL